MAISKKDKAAERSIVFWRYVRAIALERFAMRSYQRAADARLQAELELNEIINKAEPKDQAYWNSVLASLQRGVSQSPTNADKGVDKVSN